jgi:hypothetical protein
MAAIVAVAQAAAVSAESGKLLAGVAATPGRLERRTA